MEQVSALCKLLNKDGGLRSSDGRRVARNAVLDHVVVCRELHTDDFSLRSLSGHGMQLPGLTPLTPGKSKVR